MFFFWKKKSKPCCENQDSSITFEYFNPGASQVFLCGDFNNWSEQSHKLSKGPDGKFTISIRLKPGSYQYKFLVDGNWMLDQKAGLLADNSFGTKNSVIVV